MINIYSFTQEGCMLIVSSAYPEAEVIAKVRELYSDDKVKILEKNRKGYSLSSYESHKADIDEQQACYDKGKEAQEAPPLGDVDPSVAYVEDASTGFIYVGGRLTGVKTSKGVVVNLSRSRPEHMEIYAPVYDGTFESAFKTVHVGDIERHLDLGVIFKETNVKSVGFEDVRSFR